MLKLMNRFKAAEKEHVASRWKRYCHSPLKYLSSSVFARIGKVFKCGLICKATLFWGERMNVGFPEEVSWFIYRNSFFEAGLTRFLLSYLKPGMVCLDIGAHFGYFTLLCSELVGKDGAVHSFEPTPRTFDILSSNVANRSGIVVSNVAVHSKECVLRFKDFGLKYSAFNSLFKPRMSGGQVSKLNSEEYDVTGITVDGYIKRTGVRPDFIKIDAEGAEFEVLKGMVKTISCYYPAISLEVGDVDANCQSAELIKYLRSLGYMSYIMTENGLEQHQPMKSYVYDNIIFLAQKT